MAKKRYHGGESFDSMIKADPSKVANMPQDVVMKMYPPSPGYFNPELNDGLSGIDSQVKADASEAKNKKEKF